MVGSAPPPPPSLKSPPQVHEYSRRCISIWLSTLALSSALIKKNVLGLAEVQAGGWAGCGPFGDVKLPPWSASLPPHHQYPVPPPLTQPQTPPGCGHRPSTPGGPGHVATNTLPQPHHRGQLALGWSSGYTVTTKHSADTTRHNTDTF